LDGCPAERLLHAWAKDSHHHLLECTKESFVVPAQDVVRGIPERLYAFLLLLLGRGVASPGNSTLGMSFFRYGTPLRFFLKDSRHFCWNWFTASWSYCRCSGERSSMSTSMMSPISGILIFRLFVPLGVPKSVLTQNVHLTPNTQQAEQAGFTCAKNHETCQSIFPEN
jgi:hypothetical protein